MDALKVAEYIISLTNEEAGDTISNLKLQKLLYYSQGFHLAIHGKPLFENEIQAWQHGPVVPDVYDEYKKHGSSSIPRNEDADLSDIVADETAKEVIDEVYSVYGQFSAWKLRDMTHQESPWIETVQSAEITHEALNKYFKDLVA